MDRMIERMFQMLCLLHKENLCIIAILVQSKKTYKEIEAHYQNALAEILKEDHL